MPKVFCPRKEEVTMLDALSRWKDHIAEELNWADLLIRAAAGDEEAYKKLAEKEKELKTPLPTGK